jgi:hypothetical protein
MGTVALTFSTTVRCGHGKSANTQPMAAAGNSAVFSSDYEDASLFSMNCDEQKPDIKSS